MKMYMCCFTHTGLPLAGSARGVLDYMLKHDYMFGHVLYLGQSVCEYGDMCRLMKLDFALCAGG